MKLGNKIKMSMLSEGIESKYEEISQMSGTKIEDVRNKMKKVSFKEYIEIMKGWEYSFNNLLVLNRSKIEIKKGSYLPPLSCVI